MVAKKLVKCRELQQEKGDGSGKGISRLLNFFLFSILYCIFFLGRRLGSFPKNGHE